MALTSTAPITGSGPRAQIRFDSLTIEPLQAEDEDLFVNVYADPQTMHFIGLPLSRKRARANFRHALRQWRAEPAAFLYWRIRHAGWTRPIGLIALVFDREGERCRAEIGMILRADARGLGLSRFAMWMLARHAFERGIADELVARHSPSHDAARRLVERLGYRHEPRCGGDNGWQYWVLVASDLTVPPHG